MTGRTKIGWNRRHAALYHARHQRDLAMAGRFYDAVLAPLGMDRREGDETAIGYGRAADTRCRLWVGIPYDRQAATFGNGVTIALAADRRSDVDAFHRAALAAGGTCEGPPGLRPFHAHFYAAFVRDPDGNKLAAVCETAG